MTGQSLRGFVGQNMNGARRARTPASQIYPPGSYTFVAPVSGWYRFVLWGGGAGGFNAGAWGGASGALVIAERPLAAGQRISVICGSFGPNSGGDAGDSTITLPDGEVLSAGGGKNSVPAAGTATGKVSRGDTLLAGSLGGAAVGASAPSTSSYLGGTSTALAAGKSPGAGGSTDSGTGQIGGSGLVLIQQVRLHP